MRVGGHNTPIPYAPVMEQFVLPMTERITDSIRTLVNNPSRQLQSL